MLNTNPWNAARKWQVRLWCGSIVLEIQLVSSNKTKIVSVFYIEYIYFRTHISKLSLWLWYLWPGVWMGGEGKIWNKGQVDICPGWHGRGLWTGFTQCLWLWILYLGISWIKLAMWRKSIPTFLWENYFRWTCNSQVSLLTSIGITLCHCKI